MRSIPYLAYFGHHKCATVFINSVMYDICQYAGLRHVCYHSPEIWQNIDNSYPIKTLDQAVSTFGHQFVSYTNADPDYLGDASEFRAFHVIRDPRDIVVSAYFSHLNSHPTNHWPELIEQRKLLKKSSKDEGLLHTMDFIRHLTTNGVRLDPFRSMLEWDYTRDNILEIRYEILIKDPYANFISIIEFLGLTKDSDAIGIGARHALLELWRSVSHHLGITVGCQKVPAYIVLQSCYRRSFHKMTRLRVPGQEDKFSHFRRGEAGDWKNHFNRKHKKYFKQLFPGLVETLHYEVDSSW